MLVFASFDHQVAVSGRIRRSGYFEWLAAGVDWFLDFLGLLARFSLASLKRLVAAASF